MTVYMIGFMGSGKSTLGKRLASSAGWKFYDLDSRIEDKEGRTVADIFTQDGEDYFREAEAAALRNMPDDKDMVVACGGGTPCYKDNMDFMNKTGVTVYLKLDVETLAQRLMNARKSRPLIRGMAQDELLKYIDGLLAEREKFYKRSQLIVDGMKAEPGRLVELLTSLPQG
ncbi:MAG: shikimate kinase [Bacteroidales bacterium]|nr:shikimate kinase [Bacteroidales bacterium]